MRRQRVGGVDDVDLPAEDETETEIPAVQHYATIATIDGHRVARILGIDDVLSVLNDEGHYSDVFHFAVLRVCLNDARRMVECLGRIRRGQALQISNLPALLQARLLHYGLSRLSMDLSDLHEGFRRNSVIWQLADDIRNLPPMPFDLQPEMLRERVVALLAAMRSTLDGFPQEPVGRHASPDTVPAPAPAPEVCAVLAQSVAAHIDSIDALLAIHLNYPDVPPALFTPRAVEQLLEEAGHYRRVRGMDHLQLLLGMPPMGMLTQFCVSQLYLGDASGMIQQLAAAQEPPKFYLFTNLDRVQRASGVRNTLVAITQHLQAIATGLEAGLIDRDNLSSLEKIHDKFLFPAMGQGDAFRKAAQELQASLMDLFDHTGVLDDQEVEAGQVDEHAGTVAALTLLVKKLLQSVEACWGTSIEYPDESGEEVLAVKKGNHLFD